jgi:hypothetical protein
VVDDLKRLKPVSVQLTGDQRFAKEFGYKIGALKEGGLVSPTLRHAT